MVSKIKQHVYTGWNVPRTVEPALMRFEITSQGFDLSRKKREISKERVSEIRHLWSEDATFSQTFQVVDST